MQITCQALPLFKNRGLLGLILELGLFNRKGSALCQGGEETYFLGAEPLRLGMSHT